MTITSRMLASGRGWRVSDLVCTAGPADRPFEERHGTACVALVTGGGFQYRSPLGRATLVPGALLLGNEGHCFECGHDHGDGDRCLSFHFTPDFLEDVASAVPGARPAFARSHLPPLDRLAPLVALAEAARAGADAMGLEELAVGLAGTVLAVLADTPRRALAPTTADERRAVGAARRIETAFDTALTLADLADEAGASPFHFLRSFRRAVGMTPYQYLLRTRLHRAALALGGTDRTVASVAFEAGFGDLSTFNQRFRRIMGMSPMRWRARMSRR